MDILNYHKCNITVQYITVDYAPGVKGIGKCWTTKIGLEVMHPSINI